MKDNSSAHYVHYFAYLLQLALVVVAKNHVQIILLFNIVSSLLNVVRVFCKKKKKNILCEKNLNKIIEGLESGKISSSRGLH